MGIFSDLFGGIEGSLADLFWSESANNALPVIDEKYESAVKVNDEAKIKDFELFEDGEDDTSFQSYSQADEYDGIKIIGSADGDKISLQILNQLGFQSVFAKDGQDTITIGSGLTPYAHFVISGGKGLDHLIIFDHNPASPQFTPWTGSTGVTIELDPDPEAYKFFSDTGNGETNRIDVSFDIEYITFYETGIDYIFDAELKNYRVLSDSEESPVMALFRASLANKSHEPEPTPIPEPEPAATQDPEPKPEFITIQGSSIDDELTVELNVQTQEEARVNALSGNDVISAGGIGKNDIIHVDGGDGDDTLYASFFKSSFNSDLDSKNSYVIFNGGLGRDDVTVFVDSLPDIQVNTPLQGDLRELNFGDNLNVTIAADTESVTFYAAADNKITYLTEDLFNNRVRSVDFSERYARTYNENADWYVNGLDTFTEYHSLAPTPEPTPVAPSPTPTPVAPSPTPTQDVVSNLLTLPSQFKKKSADKITNFNPSTDSLEIDTDSFGIDSSATFTSGKNKKMVKKTLAKQDFDFLYDQKKGGLYFNENGADKGFGDGGIIAILKGGPDLTMDNIDFV